MTYTLEAKIMICPECEAEMTQGSIRVHGTFCGAVFFGLSHEHCWFKPDESGQKETVLVETGDQRQGFKCMTCGTVVISPGVSKREEDRRIWEENEHLPTS